MQAIANFMYILAFVYMMMLFRVRNVCPRTRTPNNKVLHLSFSYRKNKLQIFEGSFSAKMLLKRCEPNAEVSALTLILLTNYHFFKFLTSEWGPFSAVFV